ncbi:MAE_28990/MAE_18760 family HEPN-like nuclease [Spirosoma linguale]|uniref:RiboL-PSP-HEPN domain-containing protein n=1 Tax=Spirosoma linguale (strain ATCC 33905 / DSM 74 / LMG 10896 / Claus 1) TaxID=504472 RepID=D2QTQ9_SPILD|nr:hypothetical protein Slin_6232 [Spirosoma linguale DSM 74]
MRYSVTSFLRGIEDLKQYIELLSLESELLSNEANATGDKVSSDLVLLQNHIIKSGSGKKRFDYNSIVVSLYGFFEQFIETILKDFAIALNKIIPSYDLVPEVVVKNHIELSMSLIKRIEQNRYKGGISQSEVISNLHSCLGNVGKYQINADAFSQHTANFRMEVIDESFSRLGVYNISKKIALDEKFNNYLCILFVVSNVKTIDCFFHINDLADRRNEVAHGSTSTLLATEILLEYVIFCENFGLALYNVLLKEIIPYEVNHSAITLGKPIKVFNNAIAGIAIINIEIKVGDILVSKTDKGAYVSGEIAEIQVNGVSHPSVNPNYKLEVALRVNYRLKENHTLYLISK